jgi:putative membrane protein
MVFPLQNVRSAGPTSTKEATMHRALRILPLSAFVLAAAVASTAGAAALSSADKEFALEAGRGGAAEVEIARVAAARATRQEVRGFAQRLVDDHGKANTELENLAKQKGVTLVATLDPQHQTVVDQLKTMSGAAIDDTFLKAMVADHTAASQLFERGQQSSDPDLKAFAQRTLPAIQQHLEMAKRLAEAAAR